jgi:hypothetical protein
VALLITAVALSAACVVVPAPPASAAITSGITGHVTGPGGVPLAGIEVAFFADAGDGQYGYYESIATSSLGNYAATLPAGNWRVGFADSVNGDYVTEFYDDVASFDDAATVSVDSLGWHGGVDAELAPAGHITGHAGGTSGAVVGFAESAPGAGDWSPSYFGEVSQTGDFDLGGLPTGAYKLRFVVDQYAPEFWADAADLDSATAIDVTAPGTVSGIDPVLTPLDHVTGHVQDSAGAPIAGVFIDVYTYDGAQWVPSSDAWATTDDAGDYDLAVPAGTYRLGFSADGYLSEFYDDAHSVDAATSIIVEPGHDQPGEDAVLDTASSISGTVTLPPAADPGGIDGLVTVVDTESKELVGFGRVDVASGTDGAYPYTVDGLPAGSYRVEFAHLDGPATSEAQFYDDHPESAGPGSADAVVLTTGEHATGVDATLRVGGMISGRLVDGQGAPLAGCDVAAFNSSQRLMSRRNVTRADGTFVITGLTSGQYGVVVGNFSGDSACARSEYYTDPNGDLSESSAGIELVSTSAGAETQLPSDLLYGADIPPAVTSSAPPTLPSGAPVVGTPVTVDPGTWDPADATLHFQWRADGVDIPGAPDQATYTPTPDDEGKALSVAVTGSKDGYTSTTVVSNATAPVTSPSQAPVEVANTSLPTVTGTSRVGEVLSGYAGSWDPGDATTSLQWLRDGVPVAGATSATYTLGAPDEGARIALRVTASRDGYQPSTRTSAATAPVAAGTMNLTSAARVLGRLEVGRVLRAVPPSCSPTASVVQYQWLRNGVVIRGRAARSAHYRLVRADRGRRISVRMTLLRSGYATTVVVAKRSGKVR